MIKPMIDWLLETGFIYLLGVALIALVGLLLACWGVWGDRSKGRARCPECWYDMRGTLPRLVCPECGHDARQERRLHKNHYRWWRIVLGVVLVLLTAYPLTIIGGWWREQSAVRTYRLADEVYYRRIGPVWLVDQLPDELGRFFNRSYYLTVESQVELAACPSLRHLAGVYAGDVSIADVGLVHLQGLSKLRGLILSNTQVTDAGLVHLKGLSKLRYLDLMNTPVTDAGLVHLKSLSSLDTLNLDHTEMTDAGLEHLNGLAQLNWLHLGGTQVTGAGLEHLKGMSQLWHLHLGDTQVTDTGLERLKGMSKLLTLDLKGTQVTDAGVAELQQALPKITIYR
jgi:hypothetical protein